MASSSDRPKALHVSKSFTRMESAQIDADQRKRASTIQSGTIKTVPEARQTDSINGKRPSGDNADVFENREGGNMNDDSEQDDATQGRLPSTINDLPIEIRSLTERFLESLTAKVHPAPLSADQLSQMFQDFYERVGNQINTHIAALVSRIGREKDTPPGRSSLRTRPRAGSNAKRSGSPASNTSGGEMLTPSEVTDRRKARKLLELKRLALEETVEQCVCERIYEKLWKHRSTDDEARDEKLRSRTAALALVGIGLKELHTDSDAASQDIRAVAAAKEEVISLSLAPARSSLQLMNDERYPLGKLQHLVATHKSIVETLSEHFPSSSSADEILPTLIYTLITSPAESISVVSNLCYIQRFRNADKIDGETAYCLVNLEAAISFLETVDLSSLRAEELPQGPPKTSSQPQTPTSDEPMIARSPRPDSSPTTTKTIEPQIAKEQATATISAPDPSAKRPDMHQRSLSAIVQAQASKMELGRENFLSTADRVYESINGTLENSVKFVFGRFKDHAGLDASPLPKTLDDARRLISSSSVEDDEISSLSGRSSPAPGDEMLRSSDPRVLGMIAGRKQLRDRSADSTKSGGSGRRVGFTAESNVSTSAARIPSAQESLTGAANFITSINPLNRFGVPSFPKFGRIASPTTKQQPVGSMSDIRQTMSPTQSAGTTITAKTQSHVSESETEQLNAKEALAVLKSIKPPKKKFLGATNAAELRIGDVDELLGEYKRLAKAIGEAIAE